MQFGKTDLFVIKTFDILGCTLVVFMRFSIFEFQSGYKSQRTDVFLKMLIFAVRQSLFKPYREVFTLLYTPLIS